MKNQTGARIIVRLLIAFFAFQGFSSCASRGESAETPAVADDQLAGLEEPKPLEVAPLNPDTPQPLPVNTSPVVEPPTPFIPPKKEIIEKVPSPKKEKAPPAKKEKSAAKKTADKSTENGIFKTTTKSCAMKSKPNAKSETLTTIPKGRKIWVEKKGAFYKVSRVKGVGYLATSCF